MAIQSQIYQDCSGFPPFIPPVFAGGGGGGGAGGVNPRRQQFLQNKAIEETGTETETTSFISLDSQLAKQSYEIDNLIYTQNERLKQVIREQRNRDLSELLKKIEARTSNLLDQKNKEISKAKTRTSQLESFLTKLQADALTWQQVAKQNELHVISLKNTIQQQQQQQRPHRSKEPVVEDTESCCDEQRQQQEEKGVVKMVCRVCERREVGVVMLPCRHMCACSLCNPMIRLCPVCRMVKKGSVVALLCQNY